MRSNYYENDINKTYEEAKLLFKVVLVNVNTPTNKTHYLYDNYISALNFGFYKAYKAYDPTKNIQWSTYLTKVLENEIKSEYRYNSKRKCIMNISEVQFEGREDKCSIFDSIAYYDDIDSIINEWNIQDILESLKLSKLQKQIVQLRMKGLKQKEISKELNVSQAYISKVIKKIGVKIKEKMENDSI